MSKCDPFRSKTEFKGKKQKRSQGSSHYRPKAPTELTPLPPLRDAPANEQQDLFIKKLQQCCVVFDFSDALTDTQSKEIKRTCLSELVEYVTVTRGVLNENTYQDIIRMVSYIFTLVLASNCKLRNAYNIFVPELQPSLLIVLFSLHIFSDL